MGIRDMEWWQLALGWLVVIALSAAVVPRLVRSLRAPTAGRAADRSSAAPLPLWQALFWLLVVVAAVAITIVWLAGRGSAA